MKTYLEMNETEKLEDAASCLRDKLLIRILIRSGCRISEALAIEAKDIDFGNGIFTIQHLKSRIKLNCPQCGTSIGKSHSFCPGCGVEVKGAVSKAQENRRIRSLPLDNDTLKLLKEFIERGGPVEKNGKKYLFGINRHRAWQIIKGCADKAGLPQLINPDTGKIRGISPHRLRDAFAVHAMKFDNTGDGLRLLQEHLGHSSFDTTAKYRKVSGQEQKDWYDRMWNKEEKADGSQT